MIKYLMMAVPSISRKLLSAALKSQQQFGNKQGKYYDVLELHVEENGGFASEWAFPMQKPDEDSKQQVLPVPFHVWPTSEQPPKNNKQNWTMETLNKAVKGMRVILVQCTSFFSVHLIYFLSAAASTHNTQPTSHRRRGQGSGRCRQGIRIFANGHSIRQPLSELHVYDERLHHFDHRAGSCVWYVCVCVCVCA
jgi:hypothetical protein